MNVRDLTISLRPRKGWEAVDLGFLLARSHFKDLLLIGVCAFLPFWIIISIALWQVPLLAFFIIWVLKPLYDRFYLHYLSRRIFGQEITVKEVLREWKRFLFHRSIALITWKRFNPLRSMTLAIRDLEGLSGPRYNDRCRVIKRIGGETATMLTVALHVCEQLIFFGVVLFLLILIPQGQVGTFDEMYEWSTGLSENKAFLSSLNFLVVIVFLFIEPYYVGAGFCLYPVSYTHLTLPTIA